MNQPIVFPDMRLQVIAALRSLSDPQHQHSRWGKVEEGVNYYDDLTINVHVLYDDCMVLPQPQAVVPDVLHEEEVPAFLDLERALGILLRDLGDEPDEAYTSDPRWAAVVDAARAALVVMQRSDEAPPP
ncbi:SCO4402 family protein [Nocardioides nitrophenolicus]|uniref:SCO4402 family protein n=1 Tax=Nocardioides nitrophenolicus TaxID=60489 RepID=UPI000A93BA0C|nr:hypothetical protein [Nocardioides nitrophenolicus]MBM7517878.1 hypothetical protein [Nocardioides nitrophenolicus]